MSNELISVVIPTHDRADFLQASITSALGQEGCAIEVIVVDDQSTDRTPEVLAGFGDSIRVLRPPQNSERGAARNLGARHANGSVIAFLDSDDVWDPEKLIRQLPHVSEGKACVTGIRFIDGGGRPSGRTYVPPPTAGDRILFVNGYLAGPSTVAMPTQLFRDLGGFPEERVLQGSEDWLFFVKLMHAGHKVAIVPELLVDYRVHEGNSTAHIDRVAECMWSATRWIEENRYAEGTPLKQLRARTAGTIGRQFARQRRFKKSLPWAKRALAQGRPVEGIRAVTAIALSAGKGALVGRWES